MLNTNSYLSPVWLTCYEGESAGTAGAEAATSAGFLVKEFGDLLGKETDPNRTLTLDLVGKVVTEDRRRTEAKFKGQLERAEKTYNELLENKNLSEAERARLEESLEDVRKQLRTKEQQLAHEKKQLEEQYVGRLTDAEKRAHDWETRYRESNIDRALQDAAVSGDAFSPPQVISMLKPWTKMAEAVDEKSGKGTGRYKVMVDFPDVDPNTSEQIVTQRTPEDAVKRMKELTNLYGNLFKTGVVSGIGGNSAEGGLMQGGSGKIDLERITQDPKLYRKVRLEHPEWLGL